MGGINTSKQASVKDFVLNAERALGSQAGEKVTQRTFGGFVLLVPLELHHSYLESSLSREKDGRFRDADLAKILQDATAAPASAFKARGTPEVLRVIEVLGIEQSRRWGVCTVRVFHVVQFVSFTPLP